MHKIFSAHDPLPQVLHTLIKIRQPNKHSQLMSFQVLSAQYMINQMAPLTKKKPHTAGFGTQIVQPAHKEKKWLQIRKFSTTMACLRNLTKRHSSDPSNSHIKN